MKTHRIEDYSALSAPIFSELVSVPKKPIKTKKKGTLGKSSKKGNTNTQKKTRKISKKSVLIAKTYKLPQDLIQSMERIAYWRRVKIQDVVAEALKSYISSASKDELQVIPNRI